MKSGFFVIRKRSSVQMTMSTSVILTYSLVLRTEVSIFQRVRSIEKRGGVNPMALRNQTSIDLTKFSSNPNIGDIRNERFPSRNAKMLYGDFLEKTKESINGIFRHKSIQELEKRIESVQNHHSTVLLSLLGLNSTNGL